MAKVPPFSSAETLDLQSVIYGKMQSLSMEAGNLEENVKLFPCVLQWLREDETRSNTARFGDLTRTIQTSKVRRRIRTASPGQGDPTLDQSVSGLNNSPYKRAGL